MGEIDVILWKFYGVDEAGKRLDKQLPIYRLKEDKIYTGIEVLKKLLIERSVFMWTANAAYSKKLIINNGIYFNEKLHYREDNEFRGKILSKSKKVVFLNNFFYCVRTNSMTSR